jgi:SHS2 domain-containing protein
MKYEYFDVTADVGIDAYGESLDELFENAALAMFGVMCNPARVRPLKKKMVRVSAGDLEGLLREWLTQLLGLKDIYGMMFSKFKVSVDEERLRAKGEAWGEETRDLHEIKTEVKAVTYHMMEVKKNDAWHARFVLDV